jgi:hypothetical protein
MNTRNIIRGLSAVAIVATCASGAYADQDSFYLAQAAAKPGSVAATRNANAPMGTPAQGMPADRVIKLTAKTKGVSVLWGTVVTIMNGDKSFTWRYDTLGTKPFELAKIAPADFGAGKIMVHVVDEILSD